MAELVSNLLETFQLTQVPSLPHVLLQAPLFAARDAGPDLARSHAGILAADETLYLKLLGCHQGGLQGELEDPAVLARDLGAARIEPVLVSAAVHTGFAELNGWRMAFFKQHWRHSFLCSRLMLELARSTAFSRPQHAAFCGLFLKCGELVLENVHGQHYLELHREVASEAELPALERQRFGLDHTELGAELLLSLGVDSFICDALRYQLTALEQLENTHPLIRMAWLANAMAGEDGHHDELCKAASRLLQLNETTLLRIQDQVHAEGRAQAAAWSLEFDSDARLPLTPACSSRVVEADAACTRQLQEHVQSLSYFNAVQAGQWQQSNQGDFTRVLADALNQLFGLRAFALYQRDPAAARLIPIAVQPGRERLLELPVSGIDKPPARPADNRILRCLREGEAQSTQDCGPASLSIMERQLLHTFNTPCLYCEPITLAGGVKGILLLGGSAKQLDDYRRQVFAAARLRQLILQYLQVQSDPAAFLDTLLRQQKLRELVHEINNPLSTIKNYLQLLGLRLADDEAVGENIAVLKSEIDRVAQLVARVKGDSESDGLAEVDLNRLVADLARLFDASLLREKSLTLNVQLDPALPLLRSSENKLRQIIGNLIINAVEVLPEHGAITIRTHAAVVEGDQRFIELQVMDDGPGIPVDTLENIFTFGHTTKGGQHMGAGLAVVRSLADELGGRVSCRSGARGTAFSILLPQQFEG